MLGSSSIIAFVSTKVPAKSKEFYSNVLGLRFVSEDPFALVFDAGGTMLRVSIVRELQPAAYTVLGWNVADIGDDVQNLTTRGVVFERFQGMPQDDLGIWRSPSGAGIAWFKDPDGNLLSLTQF
jgi:catechol 2,3-dioxygenase-like lactoylglutathione lyase family enzyme